VWQSYNILQKLRDMLTKQRTNNNRFINLHPLISPNKNTSIYHDPYKKGVIDAQQNNH